jgi:hypothetical protein
MGVIVPILSMYEAHLIQMHNRRHSGLFFAYTRHLSNGCARPIIRRDIARRHGFPEPFLDFSSRK